MKDERHLKKQLENRVNSLEEELSDLRVEKDTVEKVSSQGPTVIKIGVGHGGYETSQNAVTEQ